VGYVRTLGVDQVDLVVGDDLEHDLMGYYHDTDTDGPPRAVWQAGVHALRDAPERLRDLFNNHAGRLEVIRLVMNDARGEPPRLRGSRRREPVPPQPEAPSLWDRLKKDPDGTL